MFLSVSIVLLGAVGIGYLYVRKCYSYWSDRGVPFVRPEFPFGNLRSIGRKEHISMRMTKYYDETKNQSSPFVGLYFWLWPVVLVTDLQLIKNVLIKDFHYFENRGLAYDSKSDPLSGHLFNMESGKWKLLRSKLTPTFTSSKMKFMFPTVLGVANEMIDCITTSLKTKNEIEIRDLLNRFTTDIIGTCAFGIECNSLKDPNALFNRMGQRSYDDPIFKVLNRTLTVANRKLARLLNLTVHHKDVAEFFNNIVKETIEFREENNVQRRDFMDMLIQLKNFGYLKGEDDQKVGHLSVDEIAAEAFVFFFAGFETSSTILTHILHELAQPKHKYIQDKARAETNAVLTEHDGQLTYEGLNEMHYIDQIVNESMRKYPPAGSLFRAATKDYKCADTKMTIPKGMVFIIPVHGIHHDPDIYERPDEFIPERFSPEEVQKRPSCSFLPFGDGPRNCIGRRFGIMELRIGLALLLKHFQFSICDRTPSIPMDVCPKKLILSPIGGVWLNVETV